MWKRTNIFPLCYLQNNEMHNQRIYILWNVRIYLQNNEMLSLFHSFYSACLQNILSGDMWMPRCLVINLFLTSSFHSRWHDGVLGWAMLRGHWCARHRARTQLPRGWPWAQGNAAQEVQWMPQSSSIRVPEEAEEREATKRCKDGVAGVVEHALPLALSHGRGRIFSLFNQNLMHYSCCLAWCCAADRKKIRWGSQRWLASTQSRSTIGSSTRGRGIGSRPRTCGSRSWRALLVDLLGQHSTSTLAQSDPEPASTSWAENWPAQSVAWPGLWRSSICRVKIDNKYLPSWNCQISPLPHYFARSCVYGVVVMKQNVCTSKFGRTAKAFY